MAIENDRFIAGLPINNCDFPWLCKRLPEAIVYESNVSGVASSMAMGQNLGTTMW